MVIKMKEDNKFFLTIIFGIVLFFGIVVHGLNTITEDKTVYVTQIREFKNRIFIYSYDSQIGFFRWPYGDTMDQLRIIEPGNIYRIVFTGYRVISVEKVI